jgi:ATP-binding cassette subfamily F protein 3
MSVLTATHLGQSFGAYDVFSGVSASIPADGRVGLVGPNGVGKTTLLLILAGMAQPSSGQVHIARGTRLGYLSQESSDAFVGRSHTVYDEMRTVFAYLDDMAARLRQMEAAMGDDDADETLLADYSALQERFELAGGYEFETQIKRTLTGLGFDEPSWTLPLEHLSGGQKTRALLARLLLEKPDLLILDEPTNHLDVQAIEWLESTLRTWPGALLVVSHDRYFLDRVANTIWEMSTSGVEIYRGGYTAYLQQRGERWERKQKQYEALMERIDKEMDFIRRNMAGQRTQMAQGKLSRLAREVEAIHAGGLDVLAALKSKGWLQVQQEVGMASRPAGTISELQQRIGELQPPVKPPSLQFQLPTAMRSGNIVLRTKDLEVGYPGNTLFTTDDIELHRREIAGLIGPNGTGKTTFLRTILNEMPPLAGTVDLGASLKVGYFAQAHDDMNPDSTVLDELMRHQPMPISEARGFLARYLFRGDDVYNRVSTLSGGEQARLALAILALEQANFLLLDEPTNHLDIPAQETLQEALENFEGTILLVSHDRYLIDRLATQVWELRDGRLRVYGDGYQNYLTRRDQEGQIVEETITEVSAPERTAVPDAGPALSKNAQRRHAQRLQALEDQVHELELELERLTDELQEATLQQEVDEIVRISHEYGAVEETLVDVMARWEAAHEH